LLLTEEAPRGVKKGLQVVVEVYRGLIAIIYVPCECLEHNFLELLRNSAIESLWRHDLDVSDLLECREVASSDEKPLSGEQLIKADAERKDVTPPIERRSADLLGRHITKLSLEDPRLRLTGFPCGFCNPKIDDFDVSVIRNEN